MGITEAKLPIIKMLKNDKTIVDVASVTLVVIGK
jgi:hypothetical protein